jgi:hypothetical protein
LAACGTTKSIGTWKDPAFSMSKYKNAIVIGVTYRDTNRRIFEDEFVRQLQDNNFKAIASYPLFSLDEIEDNRAAIEAQLRQRGIDSVIVTRMVDKTTEEKYYPPTVTYVGPPRAYYGGWHSYYHMGYSTVSSPGYSTSHDVVKLECNVYDFGNEELVFSGLSETTISRGKEREVVDSVVKALIKSIFAK